MWDYQDSSEKLNQWTTVKNTLNDEYKQLIQTKQITSMTTVLLSNLLQINNLYELYSMILQRIRKGIWLPLVEKEV